MYEEIVIQDNVNGSSDSPETTGYLQDNDLDTIQANLDDNRKGQKQIYQAKQYLAICHRELGHYNQAITQLEELSSVAIRGLTNWDLDFIYTKHVLASCLLATGRVSEALLLLEEVLKLRRNILGSHHPETVKAQGNYLACLNECAGVDANEVLHEYEDVIGKQLKVLGDQHPDTLKLLLNYSHALIKYGRHREALKHGRYVLKLRENIFGERHQYTLKALNTVATCLKTLGDVDEALKAFREILERRLRIFKNEPNHPSILAVRQNIATCLIDKNKPKEAMNILTNIRGQLAPAHPITRHVEHNISICLRKLGKYDQAIELIQERLAKEKSTLGENHVDTIATEHSLAISLHWKGDLKAAWELYENVLEWRRENLGEHHQDTENTKRNMTMCKGNGRGWHDNEEKPNQARRRQCRDPSETLTRKYFFKRCCCAA